jgi:alanine racemase
MTFTPRIAISADLLAANLRHAKKTFAAQGSLMMAVKSNAYGHGDELIVPLAINSGVDELAVLDIPTALRIRRLAPSTPLFAWLLSPTDDFSAAAAARVELGVSSLWQLDAIEKAQPAEPVVVHLKIDTGLHRNGATEEQWPELVERAAQLQQAGVIRVRAVWSHLADTSVDTSREALEKLRRAVSIAEAAGVTPEITHLAASHAAVELPEARLDLVRLGILAYGVSPFDAHSAQELGFEPALTLWAPVIEHQDNRLSLGVGFGHGLMRPHRDGTMRAGGAIYRLEELGAESSTWLAVDSPGEIDAGAEVAIFGAEAMASAEEWAGWCGTIGDEVLSKLSPQLTRALVD